MRDADISLAEVQAMEEDARRRLDNPYYTFKQPSQEKPAKALEGWFGVYLKEKRRGRKRGAR
jgi:hypothetical protein